MGFLKHFIKSAYYQHLYYNKHNHGFHGNFMRISLIDHFLKKGKKLIYVLFAVIGLILLLLIGLLIALSPMILSGIDWVYHNGISGIVKLFQAILDKLWKGAGL